MNHYIIDRDAYYQQLPVPNETIKLYETETELLEAYSYSPARLQYGDHNIWIQDMVSRGITMETCYNSPFPIWLNDNSFHRALPGKNVFVGDVYMGGNLYHFIFDHLARAWWLSKQVPDINKYIFYDNCEPWSRYIISLFFDNVLYVESHYIYLFGDLYFFNNINKYRNEMKDDDPFPRDQLKKRRVHGPALKCPHGFLPELREKILTEIQEFRENNYFTKINKMYVSRRRRDRRGIVNEEEIENLLISKGFKIVYFEDYLPIDQLALWNGADIIITPHGAAQSNMIAQRRNTIVYEFDVKNSEVYQTLAKLLNVNITPIYVLDKISEDKYRCDIHKLKFILEH